MTWNHDMTQAPRDGTPILLYGKAAWQDWDLDDGEVVTCIGAWDVHEWRTVTLNPYQDYIRPIAWMPLPPPPETPNDQA